MPKWDLDASFSVEWRLDFLTQLLEPPQSATMVAEV
jgi:hypothetical protein